MQKPTTQPLLRTLCLITDLNPLNPLPYLDVIEVATTYGFNMVQLRDKKISDLEFTVVAQQIKKILKNKKCEFFINDRVLVAKQVCVDGVHLGQEDMPVEVAKNLLGPNYKIGLSVENLEQARISQDQEVNYLGLSAVFATKTKKDVAAYWTKDNISKLQCFNKHSTMAVGGIKITNAKKVREWGVDSLALVSEIFSSESLNDVKDKTILLKEILGGQDEN